MTCLNNTNLHSKPLAILTATIALSLPPILHAEGAIRTFQCTIASACDASGTCTQTSGTITFHMEPLQLNAKGTGEYRLSYEDKEVIMHAASDAGPFMWAIDETRHTLLVNTETSLLWHSLSLATLTAHTQYLQCTLQQ